MTDSDAVVDSDDELETDVGAGFDADLDLEEVLELDKDFERERDSDTVFVIDLERERLFVQLVLLVRELDGFCNLRRSPGRDPSGSVSDALKYASERSWMGGRAPEADRNASNSSADMSANIVKPRRYECLPALCSWMRRILD